VKQYWVYILLCWDGSYYVGVTSALETRLGEHDTGADPACFTASRPPVLLVFSAVFGTPEEAIAAEKRLKGWSRAKQRALIRGDWDAVRELSRGRWTTADGAMLSHPSTSSG
jgi:putative endonuclease